jgi:hypothetical protein
MILRWRDVAFCSGFHPSEGGMSAGRTACGFASERVRVWIPAFLSKNSAGRFGWKVYQLDGRCVKRNFIYAYNGLL